MINNTASDVQVTYFKDENILGIREPNTFTLSANGEKLISVYFDSAGHSEMNAVQNGIRKQYVVWHEQPTLAITSQDFNSQ